MNQSNTKGRLFSFIKGVKEQTLSFQTPDQLTGLRKHESATRLHLLRTLRLRFLRTHIPIWQGEGDVGGVCVSVCVWAWHGSIN